MQNRFGLKDFVLVVLVLAVGVAVIASMYQSDRQWRKLDAVQQQLSSVESQLGVMKTRLESGVAVAPGAPKGPDHTAVTKHDESWARPDGGKVQWQPPWDYATDPRTAQGFQTGGEFTETFTVQPAKILPEILTDVYGQRVVDLVVATLGAYDPKTLRIRGWLADAWQEDPKGLWARVKIRDDANFSDGTPVTAEDVRWTFHDYILNSQIDAQRARSTLDTLDKVTVVSDKVVEFSFKEVYFLNLEQVMTLSVLPEHFYKQFQPSQINQATGLIMGAGPYMVPRETLDIANQWAPPQILTLVRNEQYFGPRSPIDRLRYKAIKDEQARLVDYKNGQADMIEPTAPQFVSNSADPEFTKNNQCLNWVNMRSLRAGIIWNCGPRNGVLTPFHDKRVRIAMTMMLDRERMVKDIWKGLGKVAYEFAGPQSPAFNKDIKPWPYDPDGARKLLKEAGWEDRDSNGVLEDKDGHEFVFEMTYFGGGEIAEQIATFIKDACTRIGIRVTLRQMDWSVGDPVRNHRDFDAMLMGWGANGPESDPKQIFHSDSIKNEGDNFGQWSSPEADKYIDQARREINFEKRQELWHQFERVMHEEQPYTWVRVAPYTRFVKGDIGNVHTYPKGLEEWEFFHGSHLLPAPAN